MDKGVSEPLYGNYRAKVVDNVDKEQFGRVLVYVPDLMPELDDTVDGIWARPANNPMGGRNTESEHPDNHYAGSSYIPLKGSWTWVFFESGNINRPYYFGALDIENTKVLPENQLGGQFQLKYTIFKSHSGRAIVISDDPDDARVEITGKKREISNPPSGDTASVYNIDGNMTTIFLDERTGTQKLLIRTYLGDFLHIDIDERKLQAEFESDIIIKTNGKFQLTAKEDIDVRSTDSTIKITAKDDIDIRSTDAELKITAADDIDVRCNVGDIRIQATSGSLDVRTADTTRHYSGGDMNIYSNKVFAYQAAGNIEGNAGGNMNHNAAGLLNEQQGAASAANALNSLNAAIAPLAEPEGERNT